jgi:aminobenzoyl-glutamate transport protein
MLFVIIGLGYGVMTKTIKSNNDDAVSLGASLDGIGNIIVMIFFASLFINVFEESNIGVVICGSFAKLISGFNFTGIWLLILTFILIAIANIFCPSSIVKWEIFSGSVVPVFMNASISPEFAQILFVASDSVTKGLTPLFMYYVIYIAFMEKFNTSDDTITLFGSFKYMKSYAAYSIIIWFVIIIGWYLMGIPTGIGSFPGVIYGA